MFAFLPERGGRRTCFWKDAFEVIRALGPGSVSSILKAILDVFYVVLWVFAGVFAFVILALLLISFDPTLLPAVVLRHAVVMGHAPGIGAAALLFGAEISLVGVMVIVQMLRRIFGTLTAGDPFHPDNVRRLRVIAAALALVELNGYAIGAFDRLVLGGGHVRSFDLNLTAWFAVLVIVVLAEVFREGARLRRDAELTI
jgi:hypothetical protein